MGSMASVIAQHLEKTPAFESLAILPTQVVTCAAANAGKGQDEADPDADPTSDGIEALHGKPGSPAIRYATTV